MNIFDENEVEILSRFKDPTFLLQLLHKANDENASGSANLMLPLQSQRRCTCTAQHLAALFSPTVNGFTVSSALEACNSNLGRTQMWESVVECARCNVAGFDVSGHSSEDQERHGGRRLLQEMDNSSLEEPETGGSKNCTAPGKTG